MRTYVRMMMGLGPWRPIRDLEHAIARGDLAMAAALAKDAEREYGRPIQLDLALRLLSLAAAEPHTYNAWSCRWLARWLGESPAPTIDVAAELAACLAELPAEPQSLQAILGMIRR
jgi:hypothetical protein